MEKNKKLFILFMILCVALVLINVIRSFVIVSINFKYIIEAPNFELSDLSKYFFGTVVSGAFGIILTLLAIILFAVAVMFAIRHLRDSGAVDYIKNEINQFFNSFKKNKDNKNQSANKNKEIEDK